MNQNIVCVTVCICMPIICICMVISNTFAQNLASTDFILKVQVPEGGTPLLRRGGCLDRACAYSARLTPDGTEIIFTNRNMKPPGKKPNDSDSVSRVGFLPKGSHYLEFSVQTVLARQDSAFKEAMKAALPWSEKTDLRQLVLDQALLSELQIMRANTGQTSFVAELPAARHSAAPIMKAPPAVGIFECVHPTKRRYDRWTLQLSSVRSYCDKIDGQFKINWVRFILVHWTKNWPAIVGGIAMALLIGFGLRQLVKRFFTTRLGKNA